MMFGVVYHFVRPTRDDLKPHVIKKITDLLEVKWD